MGTFMHSWYKCKLVQPSMEQSGNSYNTPLNVHLFNSIILLLRINLKEITRKVCTDKSRKTLSIVHIEKSENTYMFTPGEYYKSSTGTTGHDIMKSLSCWNENGEILLLVMMF